MLITQDQNTFLQNCYKIADKKGKSNDYIILNRPQWNSIHLQDIGFAPIKKVSYSPDKHFTG